MASDAENEGIEGYIATSNTTSTNPPTGNVGQDNNNLASGSEDQETAKSEATDDIPPHQPIPNPGPQPAEAALTPSEENMNNAADDTEPAPGQDADESAELSDLTVIHISKFPMPN